MTFEEAGARFAQAESQCRAGQMPPAQLQQVAAECRVTDPQGRIWQIEPNSRQWMVWDGRQWSTGGGAPAASPVRPAARAAAMPLSASLMAVLPGLAIDLFQRWPLYRENPGAAAGVAAPGLLSALLPPLVPVVGRWVALLVLLGCLGWLAWPVVTGGAGEGAKTAQQQMGRGLLGMGLISLIPRIWRAG